MDKMTPFNLPMVVVRSTIEFPLFLTYYSVPSIRSNFMQVRVGKSLRYQIGYIQYDMVVTNTFPTEAIVGIVASVAFVLLLLLVGLTFFRRESSQAEREYKRIQIQMDTLESNVRLECKQGKE